MVAGEARFCTELGAGDAGAPLFAVDKGGALRLAGVAVSSSGAETAVASDVDLPVLSEKVTHFRSTAYRDDWSCAALQRTTPEAATRIKEAE